VSSGPAFAPAFAVGSGKVPRYLVLLNLGSVTDSVEALRVIGACAAEEADIAALLADANWRPHLVACAAILQRAGDPAALVEALWRRLAGGSWVSPQIAATLSLVDPGFGARALRWCERDELPGKQTAALVGLLAELPEFAAELTTVKQRPQVVRALAEDSDRAGEIAVGWRDAVVLALRAV
jgi:hypothetical protein